MADDISLANLIGMDPEQLQKLLASFGPTPEMQSQADRQKWMTTGLGILAARPGNVWNAIGEGGLLGQQAGQASLEQQLKMRKEAMDQVMSMAGLAQSAKIFGGGDQQQAPQQPPSQGLVGPQPGTPQAPGLLGSAGISPRTAASFGPAGNMAGFQNLPPAPLMPQPAQPPQGMAPQGTSPQAGFQPPQWQQLMPPALKATLVLADHKTQAEYISKFSSATTGPDGTTTDAQGRYLAKPMPAGIQYFNNGVPSTFVSYDAASTNAEAARTATIEGAKTTATEAAKLPLTTQKVAVGNQELTLRADAAQALIASGLPDATKLWLGQNVPANDMVAAIAATHRALGGQGVKIAGAPMNQTTQSSGMSSGGVNPPSPMPNFMGGGFGMTADPLATKAAEAEASGIAGVHAQQYAKIDLDADKAAQLKGRLVQASTLLKMISPNMIAPQRQAVGEFLNAMGAPSDVITKVTGGDLGAMQTFTGQMYRNAIQNTLSDMGGVPRNYMEVATEIKANPSMTLTPAADALMIQFADGAVNRYAAKQQARDAWLDPHRGAHNTLAGFEGAFNRDYPASNFLPSPEAIRTTLGGPRSAGTAAPSRVYVLDQNGRLVQQR